MLRNGQKYESEFIPLSFMRYVFIFLHEELAYVEILLETQDRDVEVLLDIQMLCLKLFSNFGLQ